jgi:hypothetical protein
MPLHAEWHPPKIKLSLIEAVQEFFLSMTPKTILGCLMGASTFAAIEWSRQGTGAGLFTLTFWFLAFSLFSKHWGSNRVSRVILGKLGELDGGHGRPFSLIHFVEAQLNQDIGLLCIKDGKLTFAGSETHFALAAVDVREVRISLNQNSINLDIDNSATVTFLPLRGHTTGDVEQLLDAVREWAKNPQQELSNSSVYPPCSRKPWRWALHYSGTRYYLMFAVLLTRQVYSYFA